MKWKTIIGGTAIAILSTSPAFADVITQTLPAVQTQAESIATDLPVVLTGNLFNPALGTLTSVTGELTGTLNPAAFTDVSSPPPSVTLRSHLFFNFGGADPNQEFFPLETAPLTSAGTYRGAPISVDFTTRFDTAAYIAPGPSSLTGQVGAFAFGTAIVSGVHEEEDFTSFNGTFLLTYDYTPAGVPEPSSFLLLGAGAFAAFGYRSSRTLARPWRRRTG